MTRDGVMFHKPWSNFELIHGRRTMNKSSAVRRLIGAIGAGCFLLVTGCDGQVADWNPDVIDMGLASTDESLNTREQAIVPFEKDMHMRSDPGHAWSASICRGGDHGQKGRVREPRRRWWRIC